VQTDPLIDFDGLALSRLSPKKWRQFLPTPLLGISLYAISATEDKFCVPGIAHGAGLVWVSRSLALSLRTISRSQRIGKISFWSESSLNPLPALLLQLLIGSPYVNSALSRLRDAIINQNDAGGSNILAHFWQRVRMIFCSK
jgi:hypothetical protein